EFQPIDRRTSRLRHRLTTEVYRVECYKRTLPAFVAFAFSGLAFINRPGHNRSRGIGAILF
ncbi:MAG: hypothetical protein KC445_21660, partial [Anaerolineales bacterium]|nr:hypothetical protein [Anaerolineales bacterium]